MNNNTADGMAEIGKQMEVFAQKVMDSSSRSAGNTLTSSSEYR
jgi:hypothetical protein